MPDFQGTARVLITSMDGNVTHPFRWNQTVDEVRKFGYERLVQDKGQVPFPATWIEHSGTRLDAATRLSDVPGATSKPGNEPELTVSLAWTSQGGSASSR